ncbi:MAG TPA: hypothetical protein VLH79_03585 [Chthonomonadales bacterium]|nr:hypothetical protein [Chthonomonadales bacterium]
MRTQVSPAVAALIIAVALAVVVVLGVRMWTAVETPPPALRGAGPPPPGSFTTPTQPTVPVPSRMPD